MYSGLCLEIKNSNFWYGGGLGIKAIMMTDLPDETNPYPYGFLGIILMHFFNILLLAFMQFFGNRQILCCTCMATHCLPITRKTYLDPENLNKKSVTKNAVADFQNNFYDKTNNDYQENSLQINQKNWNWYVDRYIIAVIIFIFILSIGAYVTVVGIATGNGLYHLVQSII